MLCVCIFYTAIVYRWVLSIPWNNLFKLLHGFMYDLIIFTMLLFIWVATMFSYTDIIQDFVWIGFWNQDMVFTCVTWIHQKPGHNNDYKFKHALVRLCRGKFSCITLLSGITINSLFQNFVFFVYAVPCLSCVVSLSFLCLPPLTMSQQVKENFWTGAFRTIFLLNSSCFECFPASEQMTPAEQSRLWCDGRVSSKKYFPTHCNQNGPIHRQMGFYWIQTTLYTWIMKHIHMIMDTSSCGFESSHF